MDNLYFSHLNTRAGKGFNVCLKKTNHFPVVADDNNKTSELSQISNRRSFMTKLELLQQNIQLKM
jgi:hypothetical protein